MKRLKELEEENARLRRAVSDLTLEKLILREAARETSKPRPPPRLHRSRHAELDVSERRACRVLGQHRSTQRKTPSRAGRRGGAHRRHRRAGHPVWPLRLPPDHGAAAASRLGGERQAGRADLAAGGAEGAEKQPKKGRLWLNDGSCVRLRPERPNHVWSYDFVEDRTHNGRKFRMLNVIDEFTRECLAIRVDRKLKSTDVIDVLSDLFILRGVPGHIRSDNGPEFIAKAVREWIAAVGARTAYIEPGSPWENGYCESFNSKLRDELLNGEIFYTLEEAKIVIESWRQHYNTAPPALELSATRPPAPQVVLWPAAQPRPAPPATPAVAPRPDLNPGNRTGQSGNFPVMSPGWEKGMSHEGVQVFRAADRRPAQAGR